MSQDKHAGNVILLRTASITMLIALILAWLLVMSRFKIPVVIETFESFDSLLSSHLDFLMMTMLLLGFYASKIPLPKYVLWAMAIGSIGNPLAFLLGSMYPPPSVPEIKLFGLASSVVTTVGYGMASIKFFRYSLKD